MNKVIKANDLVEISITADGKKVEKEYKLKELLEKELKYIKLLKYALPCEQNESTLIFPYCDSLDSLLKAPCQPSKASDYILRIIEILTELKAKEVVHRDIKASNLYLYEKTIMLADFETVLENDSENTCGTPGIMAPEQYLNSKVDWRADQYAAGVVIFRILTGCMPFSGKSSEELMKKQQTVPDPAQFNIKLKTPLCRFLQKILAVKPEDRFQTPEDIKLAFDIASAMKNSQPVLKTPSVSIRSEKNDLKTIKRIDRKRIISSVIIILLTLLLLKKIGGL